MLLKSTIAQIIEVQRANLLKRDKGLKREVVELVPELSSHALIVSGVRRCGKSTLLFQLLTAKYKSAIYLNFEDPRLYDFERNDFTRLDEIIDEANTQVLFFDEIQIVKDWERYVRQKLDENYKIIVTGSNASLLSKELGTKLTGRHITKELFPFSFKEFNLYKKKDSSEKVLAHYLKTGGVPEYVKEEENEDILSYLFDDILVRDIAVRYAVRDIKTLQRLALYLISNVGTLITGNKLKSLFGVGATSTIMEYLSHLEYSYLLFFVPKFSYSLRKQIVNPRKVYAIDTGLVNVNSASFTDDNGRKFENLVFLHLRRKYTGIYYFSEKGECDFIIYEKEKILEVIQVCFTLNQDNLERELNGLFEALEFFNLSNGTIVTLNQNDCFERNGKTANIIKGYEYLLNF